MELKEIKNLLAAFIVLSIVAGFSFALKSDWNGFAYACVFSLVILFVAVSSKKIMAFWLNADVVHEIWQFQRYGFKPHWRLKKPIPGGIILPLFLSLFSLGFFKFPIILNYETVASKYRAAKRFGFYSFTEMTEWHNSLIGAASIVSMFVLAILAYFFDFGYLAGLAAYYAFANMVPISKSDGSQIFFGSRVLYAILAVISIIFLGYALFLV